MNPNRVDEPTPSTTPTINNSTANGLMNQSRSSGTTLTSVTHGVPNLSETFRHEQQGSHNASKNRWTRQRKKEMRIKRLEEQKQAMAQKDEKKKKARRGKKSGNLNLKNSVCSINLVSFKLGRYPQQNRSLFLVHYCSKNSILK